MLAPVVRAWLNSVMAFVTDGGKPKLATSCARVVDVGREVAVSVPAEGADLGPEVCQFGVQLSQERGEAVGGRRPAADWAVLAACVACPLSLVVAGAAVNGVS